MNFDFTQILILLLIALQFGEKTLLQPILKKMGFSNGNGYQKEIDELREHARVANQEVGEIRDSIQIIQSDLRNISSNVAYLKGKMDI